MNGGSPNYHGLMRINKTGEMRLRNKVGNAILKENTYEERALRTRLQTIKKHQDRNDRYLTHKQLEFATSQVSASEERPFTTGSSGQDLTSTEKPLSLPPINEKNAGKTTVSKSAPELRKTSDTTGSDRVQGRWEKAITLVRQAVSQRSQRRDKGSLGCAQDEEKFTLTAANLSAKMSDKGTNFPPIDPTTAQTKGRRRKKGIQKQLSLPEMIQTSRKKSLLGLQDPRFQRLEQCLQEAGLNKTETVKEQATQRHGAPNNRMSMF